MGSDKKNLEGIIFIGISTIAWCIAGNISYFFIRNGIYNSLVHLVDIESSIIMVSLPLIAMAIGTFANYKIEVTEEKLYEINKKMLRLKLLNIIFIGYIAFTLFVVRDGKVILSSIIMEITYIFICILKRKIYSLELNDIQMRWRKAYDFPGSEETQSSILWRMKICIYPHVYVPFKKRLKGIRVFNWIFMLIWILSCKGNIILSSFIIIVFLSDILYIIDIVLGLYTKTTGLCTAINSYERKGVIYYTAYITDYENKREIKVKTRDICYISERDMVTVVYSSIGKKVIEVEGMRMDIL